MPVVCAAAAVDAAQRGIWPILVSDASTTVHEEWHSENCKRFAEVIGKVATMLTAAKKPLIIAGLEVTKSGAQQDLINLAELLGVPVAIMGATPGGTCSIF